MTTLAQALHQAGRRYLERVLAKAGGDRNKAAELAGVHRVTLWRALQKFDVKVERRT